MVVVALMAFASFLASALDPSPLQDICVGINDPKNAGISIFFMCVCKESSMILPLFFFCFLFR